MGVIIKASVLNAEALLRLPHAMVEALALDAPGRLQSAASAVLTLMQASPVSFLGCDLIFLRANRGFHEGFISRVLT